jgi:LPXTG-motif cell wall-anchored protein
MTFSGLPPFEQTGTPSPASVSPTALLPHTGTDDSGFVPVAAMLFFAAALAGAALVRARDHRS